MPTGRYQYELELPSSAGVVITNLMVYATKPQKNEKIAAIQTTFNHTETGAVQENFSCVEIS